MKERENPFFGTIISFGTVIRTDFENVERIRTFILNQPNTTIAYQKVSLGKLWINGGD